MKGGDFSDVVQMLIIVLCLGFYVCVSSLNKCGLAPRFVSLVTLVPKSPRAAVAPDTVSQSDKAWPKKTLSLTSGDTHTMMY